MDIKINHTILITWIGVSSNLYAQSPFTTRKRSWDRQVPQISKFILVGWYVELMCNVKEFLSLNMCLSYGEFLEVMHQEEFQAWNECWCALLDQHPTLSQPTKSHTWKHAHKCENVSNWH